ncbi:MAG: hypothetical protein COV52_01250 [Gammaproteobacteria bacterium CG11_big_fil_rev_8_21_14_0_20_46_22]|nr:MAG: hypothetical protein COW05_02430 [Gammaproteobacteria bacterium CG12_big_fil_rev_8_21_14_0_65_46_12]PIR11955.1 MAG: hypothetical protein COV52_01250 [Gammaproteobacteria bacterium CG11_big_fil_rev_8_21_14_0_20_46_22]
MINRKQTTIIISCLLPVLAFSAPKKTLVLSLRDAVYLSLRNNPSVITAENDRITQKISLLLAEYNFQPQYKLDGSAEASQGRSDGVYTPPTPSYSVSPSATLNNHYGTQFSLSMDNNYESGVYNPGVTFQIVQPLIRGFGKPIVDIALEDAVDTEYTNKLQFKETAMQTITTVLNDYFSLMEAKQSLEISYESLKQNKQTVANDEEMIKAGRMAGADIVQAKAQVATTMSTIESNKNTVESARAKLLDDLGLPENTPIDVPTSFSYPATVKQLIGKGHIPSMKKSIDMGLQNNTNYQVARIAIGSLRRSVLQAVNNNEWQLNLTASTTRGGGSGAGANANLVSLVNSQNYNNSVKLDLDIPVDNFQNKADIVNAKVSLQDALINLAETRRSLIESIKTDYDNLKTSETQVELSRQAMQLQQQTYDLNRQKFLAGKISNFELLTQQQDLTTAKTNLISSQIAYLNAVAAFEQQIGVTLAPWHVRVRY